MLNTILLIAGLGITHAFQIICKSESGVLEIQIDVEETTQIQELKDSIIQLTDVWQEKNQFRL